MTELESDVVRSAVEAWQSGKTTEDQLAIAIEATEFTLNVLRAYGANWVTTMGLQTTLTSMTSARESRQRDKR